MRLSWEFNLTLVEFLLNFCEFSWILSRFEEFIGFLIPFCDFSFRGEEGIAKFLQILTGRGEKVCRILYKLIDFEFIFKKYPLSLAGQKIIIVNNFL